MVDHRSGIHFGNCVVTIIAFSLIKNSAHSGSRGKLRQPDCVPVLWWIRYGPGSLVSRERSALAAARVLNDAYRIPLAVVTNGRDAILLDTVTGKLIKTSMTAIPDKNEALRLLPKLIFLPPQEEEKRIREKRILNAFDLERCCIGI